MNCITNYLFCLLCKFVAFMHNIFDHRKQILRVQNLTKLSAPTLWNSVDLTRSLVADYKESYQLFVTIFLLNKFFFLFQQSSSKICNNARCRFAFGLLNVRVKDQKRKYGCCIRFVILVTGSSCTERKSYPLEQFKNHLLILKMLVDFNVLLMCL